jgi:hypothetical protein
MIDLTSNTAKAQYQNWIIRQMIRLENVLTKKLKPKLNRIFIDTAKHIEIQGTYNVDHILESQSLVVYEILFKHYTRIYNIFGNIVFKEFNYPKKIDIGANPKEEFFSEMKIFVRNLTALKVKQINEGTRRIYAKIVAKGIAEGLTGVEVAKKIRKAGKLTTLWRAKRIARTETHTAANHSMRIAMKATRAVKEKEWRSALDSRTRTKRFNHVKANGERVKFDEFYVETGEDLMYPGDPSGSAGNIINCRCVEIYHTRIGG